MTEQEVWELVLKNEGVIKREIRQYLPPHRAAEFEDMYSDVVLLRAHRIMRLFDPARGIQPITFLVKNCKWYAFEWALNRKYKKRVATVPLEDARTRPYRQNGVNLHILDGLPEDLAWVLKCLYLRNNTHREIADHAGIEVREVKEMERVAKFLVRFNHGDDSL